MREIRIGQTTNADVYLEGNRLVGRIKEFELDKVGYERVTHEALGMVGKVKLPGRTMEPIDAKINFSWLETELMLKTALPNKAVTFQFEKFVDIFDQGGLVTGEGYRIITTTTLLFAEESMDAFKNGDDPIGRELECSVIRLVVKSTETDQFIREYAPFENINRVNGADVWPAY
ncbi:MAG: phage major tail tube protein [Proteobacteria bacterium]|nr:phage major tail tube protein [Pseudomonadota bacterium]